MESGLESPQRSLWKARMVSGHRDLVKSQGVTSAECLAQGLAHCT